MLPPDDWRSGQYYFDVASNVFLRSKSDTRGLRGFMLDLPSRGSNPTRSMPGIVFHESSDEQCSWSFVGFFDEKNRSVSVSRRAMRISPFQFRVPMAWRGPLVGESECASPFPVIDQGLALSLAIVNKGHSSVTRLDATRQQLLDAFRKAHGGLESPYLEWLAWDVSNSLVFDLRSNGKSHSDVETLLNALESILDSGWFPIHLPSVGGRHLLSRWIETVLKPLNKCWHKISCHSCESRGRMSLTPQRVSAEGAIWGGLECDCGFQSHESTLLTHCGGRNCERFPLLPGQNEWCSKCNGLICECGTCKMHCSGRGLSRTLSD